MSNMDNSKEDNKNQFKKAIKVINLFYDNEKLSTTELAKKLNINVRSAQRYVRDLIEEGFPLIKDDENRYYLMDKTRNYSSINMLDKENKALLYTLLHMGKNFFPSNQKFINKIIDSLNLKNALAESVDSKQLLAMDFSIIANVLSQLTMFIKNKKVISFRYKDRGDKEYIVSPYRTLFFNGFWYLVGINSDNVGKNNLRVYRLDYMYRILPPDRHIAFIDATEKQKFVIENCNTMWIEEEPIETIFEVYGNICNYFKDLKFFKIMEILDERESEGRKVMTIKATVFSFMDLYIVLAPFIPNFRILSPAEFEYKLHNNIGVFAMNLGLIEDDDEEDYEYDIDDEDDENEEIISNNPKDLSFNNREVNSDKADLKRESVNQIKKKRKTEKFNKYVDN